MDKFWIIYTFCNLRFRLIGGITSDRQALISGGFVRTRDIRLFCSTEQSLILGKASDRVGLQKAIAISGQQMVNSLRKSRNGKVTIRGMDIGSLGQLRIPALSAHFKISGVLDSESINCFDQLDRGEALCAGKGSSNEGQCT